MIPDLAEFLEEKFHQYNQKSFIETDPISIPHLFTQKEDIEIAGFLAATIAWGQRKSIINNARRMLSLMDNAPYDFVRNHEQNDLKVFDSFVHRTFNSIDLRYFIIALRHIYTKHGGLEELFKPTEQEFMDVPLSRFKNIFFEINHPKRTKKHVADISTGSSAKRINMFLRWMVRKDNNGVDFGIWEKASPRQLFIPLDVHSGNTARALGLLKRKQNDWKAVVELTKTLRKFDDTDPVKYDFALFGLGVFEKLGHAE